MLNDYSFLTKSNTNTPTVKTPNYSFLTRTSKPKQEDEVIKADNFKVVRLPLNMGGGEYVTNPQGDLYLTPRSQDSLGGTLPGKERDHIVPVSLGGTSNTSNLQYLESKPSFWQKIGGIFGKKPTVQQSPNRQEGKLKVEQSAINEYKAGKISLPEARLKIAMENIRIQGIIPEQKKETTWGNLGAGYKDAFNQVFGGLAKEMASNVVGSFDFLHRTGLQVVRGVGTVVSPLVVSTFKLLGDKQLKGISHDEIWRDALKDDTDRMLDIGRPDEYFRARITGDTFVPSMLLHDEITGLLESSNKKWSEDGDGKGATVDWLKAGGLKFMTDWANPFYLFAIRGVRFDPRKARGKELGTITINAPKGQIGAVKPGQAVLKLETKPQNIVELAGGKAKKIKEPDIRIWANMEKNGKVKLDVRNLGGDILNKDIMKAVSEMPAQPGITPIMNLPASLRPVTQVKPIKPVITPATVKAPTLELQPLYTEASKYKSADEFIKAQTPDKDYVTVYHRTNTPIKDFGKSKTFSKENADEFFVSNRPNEQITGYGDNVLELRVKKNKLEINDEFPSGEEHYTIPVGEVDNILKTKSQLTDIWNKANKVEPLVEDPKNFKTAEDYVKGKGIIDESVNNINLKMNDGNTISFNKTSRVVNHSKGRVIQEIEGTTKDGKFIGARFLVNEENKTLTIIGFSSESKGKGYGTQLLNNIKEEARKNGITKIVADDTRTTQSLKYWEKQGFKPNGEINAVLEIKPTTKSQLISEWNKAQATIPTKPSIEPSFSRHYERIKEQYGFKDSVEFDRKTELVEKKKAFDFIQRSPEKALRIGYGYDEVPKGINQQVFRASLVASLNAQGKTALAQEVAKIQSSKMTEAAQTLAFGRVDIGTEAGIIKNITQARLEKIGKGLGVKEPEKRVEQARQVIERQAKDSSKKVSELQKGKNTAKQLKEIDDLISSIIC